MFNIVAILRCCLFIFMNVVSKWFFRDAVTNIFSLKVRYKRIALQVFLGLCTYALSIMIVTLKQVDYLWNQKKWMRSCLKGTYLINLSAIFVFAVIEMGSMMRNREDRSKRDQDQKRMRRVKNYRKSQKRVIFTFFTVLVFLFLGSNNDI